MKKNAAGLALAALAMTGCSSVDQVPLVYVSTAKVGVSVESGSAETPGASIMIGVDLTDAAYVPVAVSRSCLIDSSQMANACADELLKISPILGESTDLSKSDKAYLQTLSDRATELQGKLHKANKEYSSLRADEERLADAASLSSENRIRVEMLENEQAVHQEAGTTFQRANELAAARQGVNVGAEAEYKLALERSGDALDEIDEIGADIRRLAADLDKLIPDRNDTTLKQEDALSVYGRFSGDIGAKTGADASASVGLGKVFSTGIAAQNLTRGIGKAEAINARARCMNSVSKIYERMVAQGKEPDIERMLESCALVLGDD